MEYSTHNYVGDLYLEKVECDHEEEVMCYVCKPFCMEYEPTYDVFAFDDQCDDLIHASTLASISSRPALSHESMPFVRSSSSLELKLLLDALKYVFLCLSMSFPLIKFEFG